MIDEHGPLSEPATVMRALAHVPGIGGHLPHRPTWLCADPDCRDRWPCTHARTMIGASVDGDRVALSITMAQVLDVAVSDLIHVPGEHDLYERLLAWTR